MAAKKRSRKKSSKKTARKTSKKSVKRTSSKRKNPLYFVIHKKNGRWDIGSMYTKRSDAEKTIRRAKSTGYRMGKTRIVSQKAIGSMLDRDLIRENPARVDLADGGRVLHPENCPIPLSSALLRARKKAKKQHGRKPRRWGNCDYRSAEYVLSKGSYLAKRGIVPGSNFKGSSKAGKHAGAKAVTGRGDSMVSWWWLGSK